jgi:hypothetical protein
MAVKVGTDGTFYAAPLGTTLPANTDATLDNAFVDFGEISTEGLEAAFEASSEYVRNWKGLPVRSFTPETTFTFAITFLETTKETLDTYFGAVTETVAGGFSETRIGQPNNTPQALVIPVVDSKDNSISQWVIPQGVAGERDAITYANSTVVAYRVTFSALWDTEEEAFAILQHDTDLTS